jgi:acyl-CoA thioesterase-1
MFMFKRLVLVVLLGFPLTTWAAGTLLVFGDSLSAAYGLPAGSGWVSLLAKRMAQVAPDYKVVNASISGETASGGRRRIDALLAQHKPAVVIVELGGNDGLRGARSEMIQADLEAIIDACLRRDARVVLVGMRLPPNYGKAYTESFQGTYEQIARKRPIAYVPFLLEGFAERPELFQADGIHPTRDAQAPMLETVWKALAPLVTSGKPGPAPR